MGMNTEQERFRSFAERYVVARAGDFKGTREEVQQQAWNTALDARMLYSQINGLSNVFVKQDGNAGQVTAEQIEADIQRQIYEEIASSINCYDAPQKKTAWNTVNMGRSARELLRSLLP